MPVPSAPTIALAGSNDSIVGVSYVNVAGATGYRLKIALSSGGGFIHTSDSADGTPPFYPHGSSGVLVDQTVVNGTSYDCVLFAYNADGESAGSAAAVLTPLATTDGATYVSDTIPTTMYQSGSYPVAMVWQNTGTSSWVQTPNVPTPGQTEVVQLQVVSPSVESTQFGVSRMGLGTAVIVAPTGLGEFSATLTAPAGIGAYTPAWQPHPGPPADFVGNFGLAHTANVSVIAQLAAPVVIATGQCGPQVSLSWAAVTNANTYDIYRADVSGGPYSIIENTAVTSYIDEDVTAWQTYYYIVYGRNAQAGQSTNASTEVSAAPYTVPDAMGVVVAVGGCEKVTLTYTVANSHLLVGTVRIYRGVRSQEESRTAIAIGQTSGTYVDEDVENGTEYFYTLATVNSCGSGTASAEVSAVPQCCKGTLTAGSVPVDTLTAGVVPSQTLTSGGCIGC